MVDGDGGCTEMFRVQIMRNARWREEHQGHEGGKVCEEAAGEFATKSTVSKKWGLGTEGEWNKVYSFEVKMEFGRSSRAWHGGETGGASCAMHGLPWGR